MSKSLFFTFLTERYTRANILLLADREIRGRIAGTYVGIGHYFLLPVMMLLIYSFVFGHVFVARWPQTEGGFADFALRMFLGLIAFQFFADVVNRAPGIVLENPSYVKKVLFPLETLIPIAIVVALFSASISTGVFLLGHFFSVGMVPWNTLWLPILWIPLILVAAGIGWILAALGVFLRDLRQLVGVFVSLLMFLSPVFYPISAVPMPYRALLFINPLTIIIESMRAAVFLDTGPSAFKLVIIFSLSIGIAQFGYWAFMSTKKGFADVI